MDGLFHFPAAVKRDTAVDAWFGDVSAFSVHVNVGLLQGCRAARPAGFAARRRQDDAAREAAAGKAIDEAALVALIQAAHADMHERTS